MIRVLILCKNPLAEQRIQSVLQRLNIDVYCSSYLLQQVSSCSQIIEYFDLVFISDTVASITLANILKSLKACEISIIRKGSKSSLNNTEFDWIAKEIDGWIDVEAKDEEIIEVVSNVLLSKTQNYTSVEIGNVSRKNYTRFVSKLSKNERKFLYLLYQAEENTISRKEMCKNIWKSEATESCLSQLSTLAFRIKIKMAEAGYNEDDLQTCWGRGYYLGGSMVNFLKSHSFSQK